MFLGEGVKSYNSGRRDIFKCIRFQGGKATIRKGPVLQFLMCAIFKVQTEGDGLYADVVSSLP